jgi:hypothetical protein
MRILPILGALTFSSFGIASADAQDSVAVRDTHHVDLRPKLRGASRKELFFAGTAGSAVFALDGTLNATMIFWAVCPSRHRDDPPSTYFLSFGPCLFPSTETVAGTWLAGAFVGASGAAATVAMWRGCRMRTAVLRSVAGAAIGSLPGLLAFTDSRRSDRYPASRSQWITVTPILAGVGSALAVMGCHGH